MSETLYKGSIVQPGRIPLAPQVTTLDRITRKIAAKINHSMVQKYRVSCRKRLLAHCATVVSRLILSTEIKPDGS